MAKKWLPNFVTPEFVSYLDFCSFMAKSYGHNWGAKIRLTPYLIDNNVLAEYYRRQELSHESQYVEVEQYTNE